MFLLILLIRLMLAQQIGDQVPEKHLPIQWQKCTKSGCTSVTGYIVLDTNWRHIHKVNGTEECEDGNGWGGFDSTICPDGLTCAKNCALEGVDYSDYGIATTGNQVSLLFKPPKGSETDTGSRVYLLDSNDKNYEGFVLNNREFTFDVDLTEVPCTMNAALYFVQMDLDGGMGRGGANAAGPAYGTGYCDAQCPKWIKFVEGKANLNRQTSICCFEMDIWEGNTAASVFTPHNCPSITGETVGTSKCDGGGCGFNSYRNGDHTFYGEGLTVDSTKKFTVVTQFITDTGTDTGTLKDIRRLYKQNGKVINNSMAVNGRFNSISDDYCHETSAQYINEWGGAKETGRAISDPQVLAMSLWASDDGMGWLDAGGAGPCTAGSSDTAAQLLITHPNSHVYFSNIKLGDIDTTY